MWGLILTVVFLKYFRNLLHSVRVIKVYKRLLFNKKFMLLLCGHEACCCCSCAPPPSPPTCSLLPRLHLPITLHHPCKIAEILKLVFRVFCVHFVQWEEEEVFLADVVTDQFRGVRSVSPLNQSKSQELCLSQNESKKFETAYDACKSSNLH